MKSSPKFLVSAAAVSAMTVLLLAGRQRGQHQKGKAPAVEQTEATVDSTEEDTMAAYYERMQRWKALHGWTDRCESEK